MIGSGSWLTTLAVKEVKYKLNSVPMKARDAPEVLNDSKELVVNPVSTRVVRINAEIAAEGLNHS